MSTAIPIMIFILIITLVIFVHELGHFLAARRAGAFVEEFALGMGPKLLSFRGKMRPRPGVPPEEAPDAPESAGNGPAPARNPYASIWEGGGQPHGPQPDNMEATLFTLRLLPIGGFCRIRGQDEELQNDPTALNNKTVWQRMLVMAGGSLMNFVLAFVLFFGLVLLTGYRVAEVRGLQEGWPAQQAGLQIGDRITHVNGTRVHLYENFLLQMEFSGGDTLDVRVDRAGQRVDMQITPLEVAPGEYRLGFFPDFRVGLMDAPVEGWQTVGLGGSLRNAAEMIAFNIRLPFVMLARAVTGETLPDGADVMGPIGMAGEVTAIYQAVIQHGILDTVLTMLLFAALISTALGFFNLLPIPAMDGARLVFLAIEAVRGRPVPPERENMVHMVGFALLLVLMAVIAFRDIVRLAG